MFRGSYWHASYWGPRYWHPVELIEVAESGATAKRAKRAPQEDVAPQVPARVKPAPPKVHDLAAQRVAAEALEAISEAQKAGFEQAQQVIAAHQAEMATKEAARLAKKRRDEQAAIYLLLT